MCASASKDYTRPPHFIHPFQAGCLLTALILTATVDTGQAANSQIIGSFPELTGGFEDEAVTTLLPVVTPISSESKVWTVQSSAGPAALLATGGRSGPKYVRFGNGGTLARRLQSPTARQGGIVTGGGYIIQFYYRSSGSNTFPSGLVQVGLSAGGTGGLPIYHDLSLTGTSGTWKKVTDQFTPASGSGGYGVAVVRFTTATTAETELELDDFVLYEADEAGHADTTPPQMPTGFTAEQATENSMRLTWSTEPAGLDGGGFLLVRGSPGAVGAPNPNGIYATGNMLGAGGTVIYLGTNTSFLDTGLESGTSYAYRLFATDKAFNYSSGATVTVQVAGGPVTIAHGPVTEWVNGTNFFVVYLTGVGGKQYTVERSPTVMGPWTTLENVTAPSTDTTGYGVGVFEVRDPVRADANAFYRAQ